MILTLTTQEYGEEVFEFDDDLFTFQIKNNDGQGPDFYTGILNLELDSIDFLFAFLIFLFFLETLMLSTKSLAMDLASFSESFWGSKSQTEMFL